MKFFTLKKIISIALAVTLVMVSVIVIQRGRISTLKAEKNQVIDFSNTETLRTVIFYKNKLDRETAKVELLKLSVNNAQELIRNERLSFVKQFDGINKRLNNLDHIFQTTAQVFRELELPLRDTFLLNIDSTLLPAKVFSYRDSLNSITGTIIGNVINPRIEITVPIQGVIYWQRKKIMGLRIGRKKWFSDVTSANPFVRIKGHEAIRILKK